MGEKKDEPHWLSKATCIPGMLLFGTSTVVIQKIIFSMNSKGAHGVVHPFEKPWFQTDSMFVGMLLCLVVYEINRMTQKYQERQNPPETTAALLEKADDAKGGHWMQYVYVMAPAMCDMAATCTMNIGLLWIAASIWQMLRGSMVIFTAIESIIFLKRRLQKFHWVGISLVVSGLVVVAMAAVFGDQTPGPKTAVSLQVAGILLVFFAQIIQASQIVIEEFLLKDVKCHPFLIVGLEGFWGTIVCSLFLIPIYFIKTKGFHEDTLDSFEMLRNSPGLCVTIFFYVLAILGYNLFGMLVTQCYTAVHRTILEAVRTACIWVVNIFIYYVVSKKYGEKWTLYSLLELGGFGLLMLGLFVYNKVLRIWPSFYDPEPVQTATDPNAAPPGMQTPSTRSAARTNEEFSKDLAAQTGKELMDASGQGVHVVTDEQQPDAETAKLLQGNIHPQGNIQQL